MKNSKTNKITVFIIITIAVFLGIGGFLLFKNKNIPNNENTINEQINDTQKQDSDKTGYDFIVDLMAEPEFWGVEDVPIYSYNSKEYREMLSKNYPEEDNSVSPERNKAIEAMPNGSGWKLIDEDTATFTRGYEGRLTYNFSEFKAIVESDWLYTTEWDFNTNTERLYSTTGEHKLVKERPFKELPEGLSEEESREYIGNLYEKTWFVKNSMLNYEAQFKAAGCPLINQPIGTLASYKNKMAKQISRDDYYLNNTSYKPHQKLAAFEEIGYENVGKIDSQTLINAPWEEEDYVWDYLDNPNLIWLDDYRDVLDKVKLIPDTELVEFDGKPEMMYSLCFVDFIDMKQMSLIHDIENAKENIGLDFEWFYPNISSNFIAYYVRPILKKCYGIDAVYFYDATNLNGKNRLEFGMTDEEFMSAYKDTQDDNVIEIYKNPLTSYKNSRTGNIWFAINSDANGNMEYTIEEMRSICAKTNTPYMFSDLFFINYLATVDMELQRYLGLR